MADDRLAARYRALATEEPSAVIDDAIRAAARRGVHAGPMRSRASRWALPASIAAVLMLSVGVTLRMQQEQPGIETSDAPSALAKKDLASRDTAERESAPMLVPVPVPSPSPAPTPTTTPAPLPKLVAPAVTPPAKPAAPPAVATQKAMLPSVAADAAPMSALPPVQAEAARAAPEPRAFASPAPAPARAQPPAPAAGALRDSAVAPREEVEMKEKRAKEEALDTPERKLEKIAELRRAGRDREADEAIARFRREHPEHRIAEATWERIKPK